MTCRFSSSGLRIQYQEPPTSESSLSRHESECLSRRIRQGGDASASFEQAMKIADPTMSKNPRPAIVKAHRLVPFFVVIVFSIQQPNPHRSSVRCRRDTL